MDDDPDKAFLLSYRNEEIFDGLKHLAEFCGGWCALQPCVKLEERLGSGGQGCVYKARLLHRGGKVGGTVCVKTCKTGSSNHTLEVELLTLRYLREEDGVRQLIWHGFDEKGNNSLYLEYVPYTLRSQRDWARQNTRSLMLQLLGILARVHSSKVIHGDLKPANILITGDYKVKLADFGSSRFTWQGHEIYGGFGPNEGTVIYSPPEYVIGKKHVHERGDIYSLGLAVYSVLLGDEAFLLDRKDFNDTSKVQAAMKNRCFSLLF